MKQSQIHSHANGRLATKRGALKIAQDQQVSHADLQAIGVNFQAMDEALIGGGSGGVPGYISREPLETWLPGSLRVITQVRKIDELAGITTVGRFEDEAIKLRLEEPMAQAMAYGDNANIPFADVRTTVEARGIARFELGFTVGHLEAARMDANGLAIAASKRRAVQEGLDVARNAIGFTGYHSADTNIYGLLNDPNLPAVDTTGQQDWATATYDELVSEIVRMTENLEAQSGGRFDDNAQLTLAIPTGYRAAFTVANAVGFTFGEWLDKSFPNLRIVTVPEFVGAVGGKDVAMLFIDNAGALDESDTDTATLIQAVPVRYQVLGSKQDIKAYIEDAVNATAGVFILRPWAFTTRQISS